MLHEINSTKFECVRPLFDGPRRHIPVMAVIEGAFPGRVFVDNIREPKIAVVWAIDRWAYLESVTVDEEVANSLVALIDNIVIPDSLAMTTNWFELYARSSPTLIDRLDKSLAVFNCSRHFESTYTWDKAKYRHFRTGYEFPEGVTSELSDMPLLRPEALASKYVQDIFRAQTVIGCVTTANGDDLALCGSNGFETGDDMMIGVMTHDAAHRGKGYATAASVGFLDYCLEKSLSPLWETTEDNRPSQRLATKLGFVKCESYPVYAIRFSNDG